MGPDFITVSAGGAMREIAVRHTEGVGPTVLWLGGFASDMKGTKAEALAEWGIATRRKVVRFDYSGHGESKGRFADGTITRWRDEALGVALNFCNGPTILVGSSMGGWIALLLADLLKQRGQPAVGLVLIAPAPDFTERLMWDQFPESVRRQILDTGAWTRPSAYDGNGYPVTRKLIEDGRDHLILGTEIDPGCPVHILQGMQDPDVPWTHAMALFQRLPAAGSVITLIKDGDHRLSRETDIEKLIAAVETIV
jgi:pimeloyl-ACP methyl ester carboxylesterase